MWFVFFVCSCKFLTGYRTYRSMGRRRFFIHNTNGSYHIRWHLVRHLNCHGIFARALHLEMDAGSRLVGNGTRSLTYSPIRSKSLPKCTRIFFVSQRGVVRGIHCASSQFVRTLTMTSTPAPQWAKGFRKISRRANSSSQISGLQPTDSKISSGGTPDPKMSNREKEHHQGPQNIVRPHDWFGPISRAPRTKSQKHPKIHGVPDDVELWVKRQPLEEEIDDRVSFGVLQPGQPHPTGKKTPLTSETPQKGHSDDEPSFGLKRRGESDPVPPLPISHRPEKQSYTEWFGVPKQHRESPPVSGPQSNWQPEGLFGPRQRREPPAHLYPQQGSHPAQLAQSKPRVDPTYHNPNIVNSSIALNQRFSQPIPLQNLSQPQEPHSRTDPNQPAVKAESEDSRPTDWFGKPDKYVKPRSTRPRWSRWLSDGAFGLKREHQQQKVHIFPSSPVRGHVEDKNAPSHGASRNHHDVSMQFLGDEVRRKGSHSNCDSVLNLSMKHSLHSRVPVDTPLEDMRAEARLPTKPSDQPTSKLADELIRFIRSRTRKAGGEPGDPTKPVSKTTTGYSWEVASFKQSHKFAPRSKPVPEFDDSTQDPITVLEKEAPIEQHDPFVWQPLIHESPKTFQPRSASFRSLRPFTEYKGLSTPLTPTLQVSSEHAPRKRRVPPPIRPRSVIIRRPRFFSDTLRQSRGAISEQVANQKKSLRQRPALLAAHRLRQLRNAVSTMTDKDKKKSSPTLVKWPNGPD